MAAPANRFAFNIQIMQQAAENYRRRTNANVKDHEKELLTQMLNQANANPITVQPTESKKIAETNGGPSVSN